MIEEEGEGGGSEIERENRGRKRMQGRKMKKRVKGGRVKEGEALKEKKQRGEVKKGMGRSGGNKVFKLLTATGRNTMSSKETQTQKRGRATGQRARLRDGGLGGEEEGESGRTAVRILISGNWPPREQKLGDGRQGGKSGEHNMHFLTE